MKLFDQSVYPDGTEQFTAGVPYVDVPTSEAIVEGNWVNLYLVSSVVSTRKANATDDTKPCDGYVLNNYASGVTARVWLGGINTKVTGLTPGDAFLSTTAGATTSTAPSATGNIRQKLGRAISTTSVIFRPTEPIKRA